MSKRLLNDLVYSFEPLEVFSPDSDYKVDEIELKKSIDKSREMMEVSLQAGEIAGVLYDGFKCRHCNVLSDPFGKTATEIMSYLLEYTSESLYEKAVRKLINISAYLESLLVKRNDN